MCHRQHEQPGIAVAPRQPDPMACKVDVASKRIQVIKSRPKFCTGARACIASSSRPSVSAAQAKMSPHGSQPATATLNAFSLPREAPRVAFAPGSSAPAAAAHAPASAPHTLYNPAHCVHPPSQAATGAPLENPFQAAPGGAAQRPLGGLRRRRAARRAPAPRGDHERDDQRPQALAQVVQHGLHRQRHAAHLRLVHVQQDAPARTPPPAPVGESAARAASAGQQGQAAPPGRPMRASPVMRRAPRSTGAWAGAARAGRVSRAARVG